RHRGPGRAIPRAARVLRWFVVNFAVRNVDMSSDGYRQSDRVSFRMPIEASWHTNAGAVMKQTAQTMLVSRNGGVLRLTEALSVGQELSLRRQHEGDDW